jgi:hypothetical protein
MRARHLLVLRLFRGVTSERQVQRHESLRTSGAIYVMLRELLLPFNVTVSLDRTF